MKQTYGFLITSLVMATILGPDCASAQEDQAVGTDLAVAKENVPQKEPAYSPYVGQSHPDRVFFGDTHVHTSYSLDAGAFGNNLGPDEAHRYARGEEVMASSGVKTRLIRPLDFVAIADHSDAMGFFPDLVAGTDQILADPTGKDWHERLKSGDGPAVAMEIIQKFAVGQFPEALIYSPDSKAYRGAWDRTVASAEMFNEPEKFTAFIAYEWTSLIAGNNMHRVVLYRDGADKGGQRVPYTTSPPGSSNPRDLWKWMQTYENQIGGKLLAIAHNGNLSNGIMFPLQAQYDGTVLDETYVTERIRWEPLYEITQMKGDGEAHPDLSPDDEFADYENWDGGNLGGNVAKTEDMLAGEYGREALKRGLELEAKLGTNPYKFGLIGSTDTHTSLASTREENFFGKMSSGEPQPRRLTDPLSYSEAVGTTYYRDAISSGLAAVWATENTREALFDAMMRKETYATTGTRMTVRVFAGWDYDQNDVYSPDFVRLGYRGGVPMGSDLSVAPAGKAPHLIIQALRDQDGANLDRVQIIKGWMDKEGETQEQIYDVACADDRAITAGRCEKPVGNTVDIKTATYNNSIGDAFLMAYWEDPNFDRSERAFYYVRVLEIPTPRWTTYDAVRFGVELPKDKPAAQQERAYTSPIWYTP
jgi:Protein of unknown function (DUF3604)